MAANMTSDWWDLTSAWGPVLLKKQAELGPQVKWVRELMTEMGVSECFTSQCWALGACPRFKRSLLT